MTHELFAAFFLVGLTGAWLVAGRWPRFALIASRLDRRRRK